MSLNKDTTLLEFAELYFKSSGIELYPFQKEILKSLDSGVDFNAMICRPRSYGYRQIRNIWHEYLIKVRGLILIKGDVNKITDTLVYRKPEDIETDLAIITDENVP